MEGKLQQVTHPPEESTTEHREPVNKKKRFICVSKLRDSGDPEAELEKSLGAIVGPHWWLHVAERD